VDLLVAAGNADELFPVSLCFTLPLLKAHPRPFIARLLLLCFREALYLGSISSTSDI